MARPKKTGGVSRHGKHALGMLRVALYLSAEEKDSISHRGKALRLFREELKKYL